MGCDTSGQVMFTGQGDKQKRRRRIKRLSDSFHLSDESVELNGESSFRHAQYGFDARGVHGSDGWGGGAGAGKMRPAGC